MPAIARLGDLLDHGGEIITSSPNVYTNGIQVARKGDIANCAIHGNVTIIEGSDDVFANNQSIARVGDQCSCGAIIITGSTDVFVNG